MSWTVAHRRRARWQTAAVTRPRNSRLGPVLLLVAGLSTVAWSLRPEPGPAPVRTPQLRPLPGRPRLVAVLGGSLPHGERPRAPELLLHEGRQVIGRQKDVDVHLGDTTVSPRHAVVEADRYGRVHIRDLGALNGVSVDGIPLISTELHDGNRVQLGDVQLVYRTDPVHDDGGRQGGEFGENSGPGSPLTR